MPAKKSFKDTNPALSFIGTAPDSEHDNLYTHTYAYTDTHTATHGDTDTATHTDTHVVDDSIVPPVEPTHTDADTDTHAYTYTYSHREIKSRRLQLLLRPSTHAGISRMAERNGTSVNDVINTILENYLHGGGNHGN